MKRIISLLGIGLLVASINAMDRPRPEREERYYYLKALERQTYIPIKDLMTERQLRQEASKVFKLDVDSIYLVRNRDRLPDNDDLVDNDVEIFVVLIKKDPPAHRTHGAAAPAAPPTAQAAAPAPAALPTAAEKALNNCLDQTRLLKEENTRLKKQLRDSQEKVARLERDASEQHLFQP